MRWISPISNSLFTKHMGVATITICGVQISNSRRSHLASQSDTFRYWNIINVLRPCNDIERPWGSLSRLCKSVEGLWQIQTRPCSVCATSVHVRGNQHDLFSKNMSPWWSVAGPWQVCGGSVLSLKNMVQSVRVRAGPWKSVICNRHSRLLTLKLGLAQIHHPWFVTWHSCSHFVIGTQLEPSGGFVVS